MAVKLLEQLESNANKEIRRMEGLSVAGLFVELVNACEEVVRASKANSPGLYARPFVYATQKVMTIAVTLGEVCDREDRAARARH